MESTGFYEVEAMRWLRELDNSYVAGQACDRWLRSRGIDPKICSEAVMVDFDSLFFLD